MTAKTSSQPFYSSMYNNDDQLFANEQIQRYDADTIKNRYGDNWRNYASNVREIKQPDGSILRGKYIMSCFSHLFIYSSITSIQCVTHFLLLRIYH